MVAAYWIKKFHPPSMEIIKYRKFCSHVDRRLYHKPFKTIIYKWGKIVQIKVF